MEKKLKMLLQKNCEYGVTYDGLEMMEQINKLANAQYYSQCWTQDVHTYILRRIIDTCFWEHKTYIYSYYICDNATPRKDCKSMIAKLVEIRTFW